MVDTLGLFREIAQLFSRSMVKAGVDFVFQADPGLPPSITTDQKGLRQICINLISNALKFTEHGTVTLRVSCKQLTRSEALLQLSVQDTGIGMTEAEQAVIFNAFEQTRYGSAQVAEGVGLGLYICKNIVAVLGGRIDVSSSPGKGSCFTATLPVGLPLTQHVQDTATAADTGLRLGPGTQRVLIVDDIDSNRKLLQRLLHTSGLELHEANSADAALALLPQLQPDLILMDIRMPGKSGDTAIAEIRQLPGCDRLPIIAVTANAMEGERERLLELGATDFISKPFRRDEVFSKIAGVLQLEPGKRHAATGSNQAAPPRELQPDPVRSPASADQSAPAILVIDDNQANLQLLSSQLKTLGLTAEVSEDAEHALQRWRERRHVLVFVDCAMPRMNGFEFTRALRELEDREPAGTERCRIIAITGSPEEYHPECLAAGMDEVLGKPLLINTLRECIARHRPQWRSAH